MDAEAASIADSQTTPPGTTDCFNPLPSSSDTAEGVADGDVIVPGRTGSFELLVVSAAADHTCRTRTTALPSGNTLSSAWVLGDGATGSDTDPAGALVVGGEPDPMAVFPLLRASIATSDMQPRVVERPDKELP